MPRASAPATKKAAVKKASTVKSVPQATTRLASEADNFEDDSWFVPIEETDDKINALLYGREGSGKTTSVGRLANAATALGLPKNKGRVLIINAEAGVKRRALDKRGVDMDRVVLWPDPRKNERVSHQSLLKIYRRLVADLDKDPQSWFGVGFDSVSEIHIAFLDSVQAKRVAKLEMAGKEVDPDFVDIGDYGTMSKLFRDVMRKFRDLPCHFVATALERRDVDKDTGKPQYGPAVTPGIQGDLLGYVDFVLMCKSADEEGPYRALTRANGRYRAKDRFDILPQVMADPFMDRILMYLDGTLTPETDELQKQIKVKAKKVVDDEDEVDEEGEEE